MTALDRMPAIAFAPSRANAVVTRLGQGMAVLWRSLFGRREIVRLSELSDHELADIGLLRSDIALVRRAPFHQDPTSLLTGLVDERHARRMREARRS